MVTVPSSMVPPHVQTWTPGLLHEGSYGNLSLSQEEDDSELRQRFTGVGAAVRRDVHEPP